MGDLTDQILQSKLLLTVSVSTKGGEADIDMQFHQQLPPEQIGEVFGAIEKAAKQAKKKAFALSIQQGTVDEKPAIVIN